MKQDKKRLNIEDMIALIAMAFMCGLFGCMLVQMLVALVSTIF